VAILRRLAPAVFILSLLPAGCQQEAAHQDSEAQVRAALAKLSPEDRKLAEAQKYCAVEEDNRLGSMGTPVRVVIKGEPVFLCCKGCRKEAEKDPDATLAKVRQLRKKHGPAQPGP
jgi:hypothetical protein